MAEKKVILKDGTDELLPKTSASMVFTESGQTVEAALQNAGTGGGGTGGGIDEKQLAQYLQQHQYITQTALDEAHYLKPTSKITGYAKASNYTALAPTDTLNEALGKLEAGIGSGGAGGGSKDDVYYLPEGLYDLNELSTEEEVNNALNGTENDIISAISSGKRLYIRKSGTIDVFSTPVTGYLFLGSVWSISFIVKNTDVLPEIHTIYSTKYVRISYVSGYKNSYSGLSHLIGNEDSDSILRAFGDFNGFMKLVKNINNGNIIKTLTTSGYIILSAEAKEEDNGDISLSLSGIGPNLWGGYGGILTINYTKSSNTFSCTVMPIAMGS